MPIAAVIIGALLLGIAVGAGARKWSTARAKKDFVEKEYQF